MGKGKHTRRIIPAVFLLMALSFTAGYALERMIQRYEYADVHGVVYTITAHANVIKEEGVVLPGGTFGYQIYVKNMTEVPRTFTVQGEFTAWEEVEPGVWEQVGEAKMQPQTKPIDNSAVEVFTWDLGLTQLPPSFTGIFYVSES